jgi:hypothetical protein
MNALATSNVQQPLIHSHQIDLRSVCMQTIADDCKPKTKLFAVLAPPSNSP